MISRLPPSSPFLVNPQEAQQAMGTLGLLIATYGNRSCLGIVLQQARCEIASLLRSDEQARQFQETPAA